MVELKRWCKVILSSMGDTIYCNLFALKIHANIKMATDNENLIESTFKSLSYKISKSILLNAMYRPKILTAININILIVLVTKINYLKFFIINI